MNKKISTIFIFILFLYLSNSQLYAINANKQNLLEEAKALFYKGEFLQAYEKLERSLKNNLVEKKRIEAHLFSGVCCVALNDGARAKEHFKEIIKVDPKYNFKDEDWPPEIKTIFDKVKFEYPVIFNFSIHPEIFYPYRGDKPYINLQISSPDCLDLTIDSRYKNIINERKCLKTTEYQNFKWNWKDALINEKELEIKLVPDRNKDEYFFKRNIELNIDVPRKLIYRNGSFLIEGKEYLPEVKIKRKYPNFIIWTGVAIISGILAYHYFTDEPESSNYYETQEEMKRNYMVAGVVFSIGSVSSLIKAFKSKKEEVRNTSNIKKNQQLYDRIKNLKEEIKVEQKVKKDKDNCNSI